MTIVATGPLTNIALLLINYPNVTKYIKKLVKLVNIYTQQIKKAKRLIYLKNPFLINLLYYK